MADDKHYVGGSFYRICDMTGFKVRAERTRKEWYGTIRRNQSWEPRQPQDFVRGVRDDQNVQDARPRSVDQFQGPLGTVTTAAASAGDSTLQVQTTARMAVGDFLTIMLANGENCLMEIGFILSLSLLQFTTNLPYAVLSGAIVIDTSALSPPDLVA